MEVDRWVVPPAIGAAVFALAAVSPPVSTSDLARALRVEVVTAADGVILVRVAVEHTADGALAAPRSLVVEHDGATGSARAVRGVPSVSVAVPTALRAGQRARVTVQADGLRANLRVPVEAAVVAPSAAREAPLEALVAEGNLLPEVEGTVLVRAPGAVEAGVEPQLEGASVTPPRAAVGPCGVAAFRTRIEGMGAPVTVTARGADGRSSRAHVRLPLRPGGVSLAREGSTLVVRGAFAGQVVYLAAGSPAGARWWTAVALAADDVCPRALVPLPPGMTWARAAADALFRDDASPSLRWDAAAPAGCERDDALRRWLTVATPCPPGPEVRLALDGGARARATLAARVRRARSGAWVGLAGSIAAEIALMLGFGLRQGMSDEGARRGLQRADLGRFATGVVALMLLGFALALASARAVTLSP